jgi:NADPH-dependent ferric siderophore reductase
MAPPSAHATSIAARLEGAVALDLAVTETLEVADGVRELTLEGDLTGFAPWPGQDLMVSVPPGDPGARWRRYTVRRLDPASSSIDLWVTLDTDGPGAAWARDAAVGDHVEAVGPRGKIALAEAATHLFIVDLSGAAAMCSMAEGLVAPGLVATILFTHPDSKNGYEASTALAPLVADGVVLRHHLIQHDGETRLDRTLDSMIQLLDEPPVSAYVFGELGFLRRVVGSLPTFGIDEARIVSKPYWRKDRANEQNGEPLRVEAPVSE